MSVFDHLLWSKSGIWTEFLVPESVIRLWLDSVAQLSDSLMVNRLLVCELMDRRNPLGSIIFQHILTCFWPDNWNQINFTMIYLYITYFMRPLFGTRLYYQKCMIVQSSEFQLESFNNGFLLIPSLLWYSDNVVCTLWNNSCRLLNLTHLIFLRGTWSKYWRSGFINDYADKLRLVIWYE